MLVKYHPEVKEDLAQVVLYYDGQERNLADRFLTDYFQILRAIQSDALVYRKFYKESRKLNLKYFPFGIVYEVKNDIIYVVAVADLRRKPFYWKDRLGDATTESQRKT